MVVNVINTFVIKTICQNTCILLVIIQQDITLEKKDY